jgi:hypothetical protein
LFAGVGSDAKPHVCSLLCDLKKYLLVEVSIEELVDSSEVGVREEVGCTGGRREEEEAREIFGQRGVKEGGGKGGRRENKGGNEGREGESSHSVLLIDKLFIKIVIEGVGLDEVPVTKKEKSFF